LDSKAFSNSKTFGHSSTLTISQILKAYVKLCLFSASTKIEINSSNLKCPNCAPNIRIPMVDIDL